MPVMVMPWKGSVVSESPALGACERETRPDQTRPDESLVSL